MKLTAPITRRRALFSVASASLAFLLPRRAWADVHSDAATGQGGISFHPGAAKYYKEVGVQ